MMIRTTIGQTWRPAAPSQRWACAWGPLLMVALSAAAAPCLAQSQSPFSQAQAGSPFAQGQGGYSAGAPLQSVVLLGVVADATQEGQTRITLNFASPTPKYSIIQNDSDRSEIALAQTARGSSATFSPNSVGRVHAINFDQKGPILFLTFATESAMRIAVAPAGDRSLSIVFTPPGLEDSSKHNPGGLLPTEMDAPPGEDGFEVVPLKYADVSEVVGLLTRGLTIKSNDSFSPQEPAFGSLANGSTSQSGVPAANSPGSQDSLAESVDDTIGVDRRLNAIILRGSRERIARLKERIAQIDVPVESVLLETMFVELDETGAKNVGLDFANTSGQIAVATLQTGGFLPGGVALSHWLSSVSMQAAVYAQVQAGHGRIVSKPRISAQSGSTAKIVTGDALPILTSIALSGVNAVSQQVQYVNVGVTLQIAPRVSEDGYVTSHVFCVVSSVTGTSQGYPTISQREAETSATVRDGQTFVIGGLTQDSDLVSDTKVPGLGDLPGIGNLFSYKNGTRSKTELYIVVTPRIIARGGPSGGDTGPLESIMNSGK